MIARQLTSQPTYRRVMYRVAAGDIDDRFPGITPRKRFLTLVARQFRPPAHPHTLGFGALTVLIALAKPRHGAVQLFPVCEQPRNVKV
jgi:hypothetical protein